MLTERLLLRPLALTDEDDLLAYQSDPEVVRYIPWPARTREQVRTALVVAAARTRLVEPGDGVNWAIVLRATGRVIGQLNLGLAAEDGRQGEFGYVVGGAHTGRGYATEAARRLLQFAFEDLELHRVTARIDTRNVASAAVAAKLGMRREAEFRECEWFKGAWSSVWIYALLATEWAARATMGSR